MHGWNETIKPRQMMWAYWIQRTYNFIDLYFLLQELKESFNYGLFCPPSNGKAGKFLDEERNLGDYPFNGPVGYLEVRYIMSFMPFVIGLFYDFYSKYLKNVCIKCVFSLKIIKFNITLDSNTGKIDRQI